MTSAFIKLLALISTAVAVSIAILTYNILAMFNRTPITECGASLEARTVPVTLVAAVLAQEDDAFFVHNGVNYREVKQALVTNLKLGNFRYGASTIDMQVASLCYLKELNLNRWVEKIKETILAAILSKKYSKQEILRAYLTHAPLGNNTRGFEEASHFYFGKPLQELSFSEEWSLVLALRNHKTLNPRKTLVTRELPKKIERNWLSAMWRQNKMLETRKDGLLSIYYVGDKSFKK